MMWRSLLPVLIVLSTYATASPADALGQTGVDLGIRGGSGFAHVAVPTEDPETRHALTAGIFARVRLVDDFSFGTELIYVRKGSDASLVLPWAGLSDQDPPGLILGNDRIDIRIDYLEMQFPLTYAPPLRFGRLQPRFYAGPTLALELSCEVDVTLESNVSEPVRVRSGCGEDITLSTGEFRLFFQTTNLDLGVLVGTGIDIDTGAGSLTADLRYVHGLRDINQGDEEATIDVQAKNRSLQILLGYGLRLGR